MNTKKLLALLLAAVMLLALAACGEEPTPTPTPDPDPIENVDENNTDEPASILTMYTYMESAPEVAYTSWSFVGAYVNGVMATETQVEDILSQMDNNYLFVFNDETTVTLYEGLETATDGTYSISGPTLAMEVGSIKYAAAFTDGEYAPIMVAMLDGTGLNALLFEQVIEG